MLLPESHSLYSDLKYHEVLSEGQVAPDAVPLALATGREHCDDKQAPAKDMKFPSRGFKHLSEYGNVRCPTNH